LRSHEEFFSFQVLRIITDSASNMKSAFATVLPYWDSADPPMETESSDETVDIELDSTMEVQLPLHMIMNEVSEDMSSTDRPDEQEEEAYAFLEIDLASALSDYLDESDVNPVVLDSFLRTSCVCHNTQLIVRDGLVAIEVRLPLLNPIVSSK
jgi:hypothetical protein